MNDKDKVRERKERIQEMFNGIARRYDLLNHLLSGGVDIYWRRRALSQVRRRPVGKVLDLATGTGDFALAAARLQPEGVWGVDVALNMLRLGHDKVVRRQVNGPPFVPTRLLGGDGERLPFKSDTFDLVTVAFGIRNFGYIPAGLAEAWRVLRPGGELLVLDFCEPTAPVFRQLYRFYFYRVLPVVGGLISGNRKAYAYLPRSVVDFPQGQAFLDLLEDAGFVDNLATEYTFGISSVYQGCKPEAPTAVD